MVYGVRTDGTEDINNHNGSGARPLQMISELFNQLNMEKRIFGVILTILGIAGLMLAAYNFVQGNTNNNYSIRSLVMYGILGLVFFFAGIGLIRSTRDVSNGN